MQRIKKGDEVLVLAGRDKGKRGTVLRRVDASYVVVGVLPRGFWYPQSADIFVPLRPTGSLGDRGMNTQMIARLKPGVSLRQAQAEMPTLTEGIRHLYPERLGPKYRGLTVLPASARARCWATKSRCAATPMCRRALCGRCAKNPIPIGLIWPIFAAPPQPRICMVRTWL